MEHKVELTPLESRLVACAATGEELDCAPPGTTAAELDAIDDWDDRKIRADVLVALCTGEVPGWSVHPRRGLRLRGAYIPGQVDLSRAELSQCPLAFHLCRFEEGVELSQATTSDLDFTSCVLPSLDCDELNSSASLHITKSHLRQMSFDEASFRGVVVLSEVRLINSGNCAFYATRMSASAVNLFNTHVEGEVRLMGAEIRGELGCGKGTRLINPGRYALNADGMSASNVFLFNTHVEGGVRLLQAEIRGELRCDRGTRLIDPGRYALSADGMSASAVNLLDTRVKGEVRLLGAEIRGNLNCGKGTRLINPGGYALSLDGMSARSLQLHGTHVAGEVSVVGVSLRGDVSCREGTKLRNRGGNALSLDGMSAGNVYLRGTHVAGEVRLLDAKISGNLSCREGTRLSNRGGYALRADGMSAGNVHLQDTHVKGEVRLTGAEIRGELGCGKGTRLINPGGYALNAVTCQVGGTLVFRLEEAAVGRVNLAYAQVGTLEDDLASWPGLPEAYYLVGFSYHSLSSDEPLDQRLRWISDSGSFSPHTYTQLAEVYRRSGHEGFARKVAISREEERGRQSDLSRWVRAWNRFLGLTVAYGYQPWRALAPLVVLFLLGWFLFTRPPAQEVMVHPSPNIEGSISAAACHEPYPCFSPPIYVLDTLLPIIDLHQESNWVSARPRPWGVWYEVLTWVLIASGWILTTAVVAGIGSLWRRE